MQYFIEISVIYCVYLEIYLLRAACITLLTSCCHVLILLGTTLSKLRISLNKCIAVKDTDILRTSIEIDRIRLESLESSVEVVAGALVEVSQTDFVNFNNLLFTMLADFINWTHFCTGTCWNGLPAWQATSLAAKKSAAAAEAIAARNFMIQY